MTTNKDIVPSTNAGKLDELTVGDLLRHVCLQPLGGDWSEKGIVNPNPAGTLAGVGLFCGKLYRLTFQRKRGYLLWWEKTGMTYGLSIQYKAKLQ